MPPDDPPRSRPEPARLPDLDAAASRRLADRATGWVLDYLERPETAAVVGDRGASEIEDGLRERLPISGQPLERVFQDLEQGLRPGLRQDIHPRFFGYVHAPGTPLGAFADLIASAVNQNLTAWRSAPAAVTMERQVIAWIREMVGFGDEGEGLLTSGGSMATLIAMAAARAARLPGSVGREGLAALGGRKPTIYMSEEGHLSIVKAADLLGIGRENVRRIATGPDFRIDLEGLAAAVDEDRRNGFLPFLVVASAGTVSTGAIDPLEELGDFCWEQEMWLHVDAAYGGFAALVPGVRTTLKGFGSADSLTLDPHKWLYANLAAGCVLIRDASAARRAFAVEADYARASGDGAESFAFFDHGLELSRRFRALKLWMMIKHYGVRRLAACIAEDLMLARYLHGKIQQHDELEALCPVGLSVVCFRYRAPGGDGELDALNEAILARLQRGAGCYLSRAKVRGRVALRACVINPRTEASDIDRTVEEIVRIGREIVLDRPPRHASGCGA